MLKSFGICYNRISSLDRYGRKCHLVFIIFYSSFSLISNKISLLIFTLSHTFTTSPSLLSQTLLFSPLPFYSLLFPFMSHHQFPLYYLTNSIISIYKISFTSLSLSLSLSYTKATWFGLVHLRAKYYCFVQHLILLGLYFDFPDSLKVSPIHCMYCRFTIEANGFCFELWGSDVVGLILGVYVVVLVSLMVGCGVMDGGDW